MFLWHFADKKDPPKTAKISYPVLRYNLVIHLRRHQRLHELGED
jgi:hypothetical protein